MPVVDALVVRSELNKDQLKTLQALLDTIVSKLDEKEERELVEKFKGDKFVTEEQVKLIASIDSNYLKNYAAQYNQQDPSWSPLYELLGALGRTTSQEKRDELYRLLSLLSTSYGMGLISRGQYWRPFYDLERKERETFIIGLQQSILPPLRALYRALSSMAMLATYFAIESQPIQQALGFPGKDPIRSESGYEPSHGTPERLHMLSLDEITEKVKNNIKYDAIVIGSGAGGGVVAHELAAAGKSVLVIEKSVYYHETEFELCEAKAFEKLFEKGTIFPSTDGSLGIMAGNVFGGSTTVNWSASLKPQHFVREEWARQGLTHFITPKFTEQLERVGKMIGAETSGIQHSVPNQILLNGCKKLGYHYDNIPQNTGGKLHQCHWCFAGCRDGTKNGSMNSWLREAAKYGAQFIDRTKVLRVLTDKKKNKATGVECIVHGERKLNIQADKVIVSGGSLYSPSVLLNSGLKNPNIGKHLRVHPVTILMGRFDDRNIDPWTGPIMTAISNAVENVDGNYYGCKIEVPVLHPGLFSAVVPWRGAKEHKEIMLNYRQFVPLIVLTRDKDSVASVSYDDEGTVNVDFKLSKHDATSLMKGMIATSRILVAEGAREIITTNPRIPTFKFNTNEPSDVTNPRFNAWLNDVQRIGVPDNVSSAHVMGTNRMGISPKTSVVKPNGETWEVKDLYVADASILPTATGVNPMFSTYSISLHVADSILDKYSTKNASKL